MQTMFVPHDVPFALFPFSVQTDAPVAQEVAPVLHGLVGVHVAPAVHDAHEPLLHTWLVPQTVPLACAFPVSMHVAGPPIAGQTSWPT